MMSFWKRWVPVVALVAGALGCGREAPPPNVVVIVIDTLRADHLMAYGYPRATSPNLDGLAARGVLFEDAVSAASWTNPAMAALCSGVAPDALGIKQSPVKLPPGLETLGEIFKAAGYSTHGVISHIYLGQKHGFDQGFDSWDEENAKGHEHVSSESVTDKAIALLEARTGSEPFLLFLHYFDPHYDYIEHEAQRFSGEYSGKLTSARNNIRNLRNQAAAGAFGPEDLQHLNDLYDSEIAYTDGQVGRLFADLEARGLFEDALVLVTADHGEALGERADHDIGHGRTLFQELVRVPLIIKLPGKAEGRVDRKTVSTQNVLATLVDAAGLSDPRGIAAGSLLRPEHSGQAFSATYFFSNLQSVREGPWKLVHDTKTRRSLLFDLVADPGETQDLAAAEPEVLARLEAARAEWDARNATLKRLFGAEAPELTEAENEQLRLLGYTH